MRGLGGVVRMAAVFRFGRIKGLNFPPPFSKLGPRDSIFTVEGTGGGILAWGPGEVGWRRGVMLSFGGLVRGCGCYYLFSGSVLKSESEKGQRRERYVGFQSTLRLPLPPSLLHSLHP